MSDIAAATKKQRLEKQVLTVHSGSFHADEALSVALLRQLPRFADAELRRSRDPAVWDQSTVVIDVGAEYDPARNRFDHHQRGFSEVFGHGFTTKLSSAGLIYKHFGQEVLSTVLGEPIDSPVVQQLWLKMYADFVEAFDGIDNGVAQYITTEPPRYRSRTDISARVGALNPRWNEPSTDEVLLERFERASKMCGQEFLDRLDYLHKAWLPARDIVVRAVEKRKDVHPSGKVIVFDEFCPWKEHLHVLEDELSIPADELPLYVLYPESEAPDSKWRVQAVAVSPESFDSRKALPEAWRGVRDDALSTLTGIPGCIFVHAAGFIGGNVTKEGALQMAVKALEL
ncbi:putative GAMM1 protein [Rhodotorula diobovata]|uniref:Putative GAMM1 protein n=1 Tax=Rhodotorula diobovata TaxID=5288 RepID=A0A5C5FYK1_9BASI|nr:putative GAMM1 protein [Rhodotorula diobovata]